MEKNCVDTRTMRSQSEAYSVTQWIKLLRVTVGETVVKESHE